MVKPKIALLIVALIMAITFSCNISMAKDYCDYPSKNDFFGICSEGKWWRNFDNPELYVRSIANFYNKDSEKVVDSIGWSNLQSTTAMEEPFAFNIQAIVQLFRDDICRKRFLCEVDNYFTEHASEYSEQYLKDLRRMDDYFSDCHDYDTRMRKCHPKLEQVYVNMIPGHKHS